MQVKPMAGQVNEELSVLRRDFKNLSVEGKRGILKTAKGLLKIQRERIAIAAKNALMSPAAKKSVGITIF